MRVDAGVHERAQHVVGGVQVIVDRVPFLARRFHGIGGRALLGEMHDGLWADLFEQVLELLVVLAQRQPLVADALAGMLLPNAKAGAERGNGRQRLDFKLDVDLAARKIVDDHNVVAEARQMQ